MLVVFDIHCIHLLLLNSKGFISYEKFIKLNVVFWFVLCDFLVRVRINSRMEKLRSLGSPPPLESLFERAFFKVFSYYFLAWILNSI